MTKTFRNKSFAIFLLKLSAFFVVVFLLDLMIGNFLKKYYFSQRSGYDFQTTYSIEKTKADILILGSSRAVNIFNTDMFEKQFNLSCFNAGRYGEPIFYHYAVLQSILKRHTPRIVLLSFDAGNFSKRREAYDRLSVLLPYYKDHPEIRSMVALKGPYEKIKLCSKIYPYNSLLLSILAGHPANNKYDNSEANGYIPIKKTISGPLQTMDYSKEKELDDIKIKVYRSFIKDCIASNILLYIVCPPYMINSVGADLSIITGKKIAKKYNIKFLDYSRDTFFVNKPQLFADYRHLNETGVKLFTDSVIESIKNYP
jgi:hypothetical protein